MRGLRLLVLGAAAYGAFLVATLPAGVVAARVATASGGQVTLTNASGTAWNGAARVHVATRGLSVAIDEVRWNFLPSRLLAGRVAFAIEARMGAMTAQLEAARTPLAWRIDDLHAGGDASALAALFPIAAAWQPGGTIAVESAQLAWDGEEATGAAIAQWRDASVALSDVRPLGSWRVEATAAGASIKVALATAKGPLRVSGSGVLALRGRLAISGEARAAPRRDRALEALLDLLGPRRADGARALEVR